MNKNSILTPLLIFVLNQGYFFPVTNPFSCKRQLLESQEVGHKNLLGIKLLGFIGDQGNLSVVLHYNDELQILKAGQTLGDIFVVAITTAQVEIQCKGKVFVLEFKEE